MPATTPFSPRALAAFALRRALSYIENKIPDKNITIKATANAEQDAGISKSALQKTYTGISDARKEKRSQFGTRLDMNVIANVVRSAGAGSMQQLTDLSRETIDYDPHLGSVLQKRFGALASLPWEVQVAEGPGVDKEKAFFYAVVVRDQLRKLPNFRRNIMQLAWGLFDGRAALESHWREATNPLVDNRFGRVSMVLGSMEWVHPRRLSFGTARQLVVTPEGSRASANYGATGIDLSDDVLKQDGRWRKFSWTPQLFGDYPEKEGLAPRCLVWSFFKRFSMKDMMTLIELFGKPWRIIKVPEESSANSEDIEASLEAVDALGGAYTALLAKGTDVDVIQPGRTAGQIHGEALKEVDNQISKLVLGQTGTTDGVPAGLNSNQAFVMQDEQLLILKNDADSISEVVERQVADAIIEVNFGAGELIHSPRFVLRSDRPADRNSEIQRLSSAIEAGISVKETEAYEVAGFQIPDKNDRIIRIDQPRMEPGATQTPVPRAMIIDPNEDNGIVDEWEEDYGEIGEEEGAAASKQQLDTVLLSRLLPHLPPNDAFWLCMAASKELEPGTCTCSVCCAARK
jgi:phage gp29-like protein